MKIAAWLGCKDEVELVGTAIAHLRAIGVDRIFACDAMSTDGTREILDEEAARGDLEVSTMDDRHEDSSIEFQAVAEVVRKAREMAADWLLFCDADEFWLPASGSLKDCSDLTSGDVVTVDRFNVVLSPDGPCIRFPIRPRDYGDILYFDNPVQDWKRRLEEDPLIPWISGVPKPKVIARPNRILTTRVGHHAVRPIDGAELCHRRAAEVVIAHVPFSTTTRFARKVGNIAAAIAASGESWSPSAAWHWRHLLANVEREGVQAEVRRNTREWETIATLRKSGAIRAVSDYFAPADPTR